MYRGRKNRWSYVREQQNRVATSPQRIPRGRFPEIRENMIPRVDYRASRQGFLLESVQQIGDSGGKRFTCRVSIFAERQIPVRLPLEQIHRGEFLTGRESTVLRRYAPHPVQ